MRWFALFLLTACTPTPLGDAGSDKADEADSDTDSDTDADTDVADADDPSEAIPLAWDTEETEEIDGNDVDWFLMAGVAGEQFRIQVINEEEDAEEDSLDVVVSVYDADMNLVAWEDEHPGGDVTNYDTVCFGFFGSTGAHFVKVEDKVTYEGGTATIDDTQYTIQALQPGSLPSEPDSLRSAGNDVDMSTPNSWYAIPVFADAADDVDYVLLSLPHSDGALFLLHAANIVGSPYTPALDVFNGDGDQVASMATFTPGEGRQVVDTEGSDYVLAVRDSSGSASPGNGAWVFAQVSEEGYGNDRESEPNDTETSGNTLDMVELDASVGTWFGGYAEGHISSATDEDWYRFTLTEEAYVWVGFGALTYGSLLQADVVVVENGATLAADSASGGEDPFAQTAEKLPAGTYAVGVRALAESGVGEGGYYRIGVNATSVPYE